MPPPLFKPDFSYQEIVTYKCTTKLSFSREVIPLIRPFPQKVIPLIRSFPQKVIPLIRPFPQKVIPLIWPDFRYTEIVKYH
jgi:hypothetical protein